MQHAEHDETKLRLLEAAGEVFSEKGYLRGTIRDICAKAGTNLASVNYHFGGKQGLYQALLEHCHQEGLQRHPSTAGLTDDTTPEQALEAFIRSFMNRTLGQGSPAWSTRLLAREMGEPSPALSRMVAGSVRPNMERLMSIGAAVLGEGASPEHERHCALSLAGQCQHYDRCRAAIEILFPDVTWDTEGIDVLSRHILTFSLAAMRGYRQEGK